jgi:hypothetical protein
VKFDLFGVILGVFPHFWTCVLIAAHPVLLVFLRLKQLIDDIQNQPCYFSRKGAVLDYASKIPHPKVGTTKPAATSSAISRIFSVSEL